MRGVPSRTARYAPGLLATLWLGCAHSAVPEQPPAAATAPCDERWSVPEAWLAPGGLVMLGEMHGTRESPGMAGTFVCQAAARGRTVWLGLELPAAEQPRLDAFLAGGDERALLEGECWTRSYQDGRTSQAMLALMAQARALRRAGREVRVFLFDGTPPMEDRDEAMAANVVAARERAPKDALFVLLSGNLHANTGLAIPRHMAWRLAKAGLKPRSLDLLSGPGAAWYCDGLPDASLPKGTLDPSCGAKPLGGTDRGPALLLLPPEPGRRGFDGNLYLGPGLTASPPARAELFARPSP